MTNLEALKGKVAGYPLSDDTFSVALKDRDLEAQTDYAGKSKEFDLAMADVYVVLATAVNVGEGGYQIAISERSNFLKIANSIYAKWGEPSMTDSQPVVKGVSPW